MTTLTLQYDQEDDGRWIASVAELAGVHVYGETKDVARRGAIGLALRVLADEVEHGERDPMALAPLVQDAAAA